MGIGDHRQSAQAALPIQPWLLGAQWRLLAMPVAPMPLTSTERMSRGHRVRQLLLEPSRKAGCWETFLLSSDKNSSIFKARGRGCAAGSAGTGLTGPDPWGLCPGPPAPHLYHDMVQGDSGAWAEGLVLPGAALLHLQIRLGDV